MRAPSPPQQPELGLSNCKIGSQDFKNSSIFVYSSSPEYPEFGPLPTKEIHFDIPHHHMSTTMDTPSSTQSVVRKLVTVRRIQAKEKLRGYPYDVVYVDGWTVVVQKNEYRTGQLVVYFEIDSFIPATDGRFWEHLTFGRETFDGKEGYRVKSRIFGKVISQGIVLAVEAFSEITSKIDSLKKLMGEKKALAQIFSMSFEEDLGVKKWEAEVDKGTSASFGRPPNFILQPGNERAQNVADLFTPKQTSPMLQVTEKLDGVSLSIYTVDASSSWYRSLSALPKGCGKIMDSGQRRIGVCTRRYDYVDNGENKFWELAKKLGLHQKILKVGGNVAIQGEFCGPDMGMDTMKFPNGEYRFFVFGIWDIDNQQHLPVKTVEGICKRLEIAHVPVIGYFKLEGFAKNLDALVAAADGVGMNGNVREGFVIKYLNGKGLCKVISNKWLLEVGA